MKIKNSIISVFARHQAISTLLLLLFFVVNSVLMYIFERQNAIVEREHQMQLAVSEINARMGTLEDSVRETITTIVNNYNSLRAADNERKYFDKQQLSRFMADKRLVMYDLEYFYALRPGDFTVFQADEGSGIFDRLGVKDYMEQNADSVATSISDNEWAVCEIGGKQYMVVCCYYAAADIYVGVAVEPLRLLREIIDLAEIGSGLVKITDVRGNTFTYGNAGETFASSIETGAFHMKGHLELGGVFHIDNLAFLKNSLLWGLPIGLVLCMAVMIYLNRLLVRTIISPIKKLSESLEDIEDFTDEKKVAEDAQVYEIHQLEKSLNTLLEDVVYHRMKLYSAQIEKAEQELKMLRAQLRPHFFLNAITTVNAMTYQERSEDIRTYLMKLSGFMRYTISSSEGMVSLGEEIGNVDNYFQMQEIRYPGRVMTFIDCAREIKSVSIPRFLLLTIVENSFKYAMRVDDMIQIYVQCSRLEDGDFSGISMVVEDNGNGFTEEQIKIYNRPQIHESTGDIHIGMTNVKRTLALYYGRNDLMRISNTVPAGARVEIRIPSGENGKGDGTDGSADRG